jgi:hypothetical protein
VSDRLAPPLRRARAALPATAAAVLVAVVAAVAFPSAADAHGGLIGRSDLPLPNWLLAWGCALLLVGSFAGLVLLWQEPRLEGDTWRPIKGFLGALATNPATSAFFGLFSALLLVLVIYSGLEGTIAPDRNFSLTFVFVTFWLLLVGASVLFGNVFRALSPWRAIGRAVSGLFQLVAGRRAPAPLTYPEWLGRWPAVAGLAAFIWFELVWGQSGFAVAGTTPHDVAVAAIVYSAITFIGMALFGVDKWNDKGETFSVYFGMFASLSIFEMRDGKLGRSRVLENSTRWVAGIPGSLALVIMTIGGTTFDGAQEGRLKSAITSLYEKFADAGMDPTLSLRLTNTIFFALCVLFVAGIFWVGIRGMRVVGTKKTSRELGMLFAHCFIPIALAYLVAHYFSYVVYNEQAQFTYLLSDPLGEGKNFFGTAGTAIDYTVVSGTTIQWVQFGAVVVGHAVALALGHDRALAVFGGSRDASWSQIWTLVMMLMFSMLALWLLAGANA